MLAERKKRVKWSLNPRGNFWSQDTNKFGQRMLEKMGWKTGCGLGANEQGITENVKVTYKSDNKCIGYKELDGEWLEQQSQFENFLAELSSSHDVMMSENGDKGSESLEQRSQQSRSRVHYQKFTRGKDLSKYTDKDLACILGAKKTNGDIKHSNIKEGKNDTNNFIGKVDNFHGVTTVNGGNMNDYFANIKHNKSYENEEYDEQMYGEDNYNGEDNNCEMQSKLEDINFIPEVKPKRKRKREQNKIESSESHRNEDNEIMSLKDDSEIVKKKKRKVRKEKTEEQVERKSDETYNEHYDNENIKNLKMKSETLQAKTDGHESKRKKKQVHEIIENQDTHVEENLHIEKNNNINLSSCSESNLKYIKKKKKIGKKIKEKCNQDEDIIEENDMMKGHHHEEDVFSCEKESNLTDKDFVPEPELKMKKRKRQNTIGNMNSEEMEVLQGSDVMDDKRCSMKLKKKRERKLAKEREHLVTEVGINEQDRGSEDFDRVVTKLEKNAMCKNDALDHLENSVEQIDIEGLSELARSENSEIGFMPEHIKEVTELPKKIKNNRNSITRHLQEKIEDNKIVEKEVVCNSIQTADVHTNKKNKKRKCDREEPIFSTECTYHDIKKEKHKKKKYNTEEHDIILQWSTGSCDVNHSTKYKEMLNAVDTTSKIVICKNENEKKRKEKELNEVAENVELKCQTESIMKVQTVLQNTKINLQKSEHDEQNEITEDNSNVCSAIPEQSKKNTCSDVRHIKRSVLMKMVDPSDIRFRGSNLQKVPGYGLN